MALNLIKVNEFPESADPKEWVVVADARGVSYKISKENLKAYLGTVQQIAPEPVPSFNLGAPGVDKVYYGGTGTYTLNGTPVVMSENLNMFFWDKVSWKVLEVPVESTDYFKEEILETSKNLFNKNNATLGKYVEAGSGVLIDNSEWFTSQPISADSPFFSANLGGFYAFYNAGGGYVYGEQMQNKTLIQTPSHLGAAYFVVSNTIEVIDSFQVEKGPVVTPYTPAIIIEGDRIKNSSIKIESLSFAIKSKNLFISAHAILGKYVDQASGGLIDNPVWFATEYIPIIANTEYAANFGGIYAYYNASFVFISGGLLNVGEYILTPPVGASFLRISNTLDLIDVFQVESGSAVTSYKRGGYVIDKSFISESESEQKGYTITEIIVRSGGTIGVDCDFTDIKSALDSISDNNKTNRYFVRVKNGVYDFSAESYPFLGFKNYVEIVGQSKGGVKVINRKATFSDDNAVFDIAYYSESIEHAIIRNMTLISYNGKGPVHVDSGYNKLASGGSIFVIDCDLINENTSGMSHYQNGLACGLLDGQRVVAINVNSNGQLWVHNNAPLRPETGCTFELYNCRFPKTEIADVYCYGTDKFIMKNCKTLKLKFTASDPFGQNRGYTEFSWTTEMEGNDIGYIIGTSNLSPGNFGLWDDAFSGKFGISDSTIHNYCKNNSGSIIARGDLVSLGINTDEISIKKWASGDVLYGQSLDNINVGGYGTIQYNGILFISSAGVIAVNDTVGLDSSGKVIKVANELSIGVALDASSGASEIRVLLNK